MYFENVKKNFGFGCMRLHQMWKMRKGMPTASADP